MGRAKRNPQAQLKKVMVVSHDFRTSAFMAMMPVMTQCQMASCWEIPNRINMK